MMQVLPHGKVITAEQELINEEAPEEEIIQFCDVQSNAIKGNLKRGDKIPQNFELISEVSLFIFHIMR